LQAFIETERGVRLQQTRRIEAVLLSVETRDQGAERTLQRVSARAARFVPQVNTTNLPPSGTSYLSASESLDKWRPVMVRGVLTGGWMADPVPPLSTPPAWKRAPVKPAESVLPRKCVNCGEGSYNRHCALCGAPTVMR